MRRFSFGKQRNNDENNMGLVPLKGLGLDALMEDFFSEPFGLGLFKTFKTPAIDVYEKENLLVIKADLPGIKKENIKLHVDGDILTISGETKGEKNEKKEGYCYRERSFGRVERSIRLPEGVKKEEIKASYKDGVLNVELPKTEEAKEKGKDIEVE